MPVWGWGLIAIGVIAAILFVTGLMYSRPRTEYLQSQYGPDYYRSVAGAGDRRAAVRRGSERVFTGQRQTPQDADAGDMFTT